MFDEFRDIPHTRKMYFFYKEMILGLYHVVEVSVKRELTVLDDS